MHHQDHNLRSQNWLNDHKLLPIGYVSGFRPRRGRLNRRNKSRNSNYHLFLKGAFEGLYRGTVLIINVEYIQVLFDLIREKWTISRPLCLLYEWIFYFRSAYHSTRYFICRCQTPWFQVDFRTHLECSVWPVVCCDKVYLVLHQIAEPIIRTPSHTLR